MLYEKDLKGRNVDKTIKKGEFVAKKDCHRLKQVKSDVKVLKWP